MAAMHAAFAWIEVHWPLEGTKDWKPLERWEGRLLPVDHVASSDGVDHEFVEDGVIR